MKTIIIYESKHHGNTKKVCDRVAAECQVELIEAGSVGADFNWEDYDLVGFASGIAYSKFYDSVNHVAEHIPVGKGAFFIYTCAKNDKDFAAKLSARAIALSVEQNLPAPISKMPSWYECKICPFWGLCHNHEEADHSCRTCEHAHFNHDGTVMCKKRGELRDTKAQERGCKEFKLHFDLEALK